MIESQPRNLCRATELYLELPTLYLYLTVVRAFRSPEIQNWTYCLSSKTCCSSRIPHFSKGTCLWRTQARSFLTLFSYLHPAPHFLFQSTDSQISLQTIFFSKSSTEINNYHLLLTSTKLTFYIKIIYQNDILD